VWSDMAGAYIGATISVADVNWDNQNNRRYYGKNVDMTEILNGIVGNASAAELKDVLPG